MFWGKIGVDNAAFIVTGLLFLLLYSVKRRKKRLRRLRIYLCSGIYFIGQGLLLDLLRLKVLRSFFLSNYGNFHFYLVAAHLLLLAPIYVVLISDLIAIWMSDHRRP